MIGISKNDSVEDVFRDSAASDILKITNLDNEE